MDLHKAGLRRCASLFIEVSSPPSSGNNIITIWFLIFTFTVHWNLDGGQVAGRVLKERFLLSQKEIYPETQFSPIRWNWEDVLTVPGL